MTVIAEQRLGRRGSDEAIRVQLFAPYRAADQLSWICRFEIEAPIEHALNIHGETSLQALALALKCLSASLYSSDLYRRGDLGAFGELGGYLGIPAPQTFLDEAPYPF